MFDNEKISFGVSAILEMTDTISKKDYIEERVKPNFKFFVPCTMPVD